MARILDLFCGCGGLSLGAKNAGFETALAIDNDPDLSSAFVLNFPDSPFLLANVQELDEPTLRNLLPHGVDGIVGGPPCQAFSEIGRRSRFDPRRNLIYSFFDIVAMLQPRFFMMENVRGLAFTENRQLLDEALARCGDNWSIVGPIILDAADFGAATKRPRLFVFGFDTNRMDVPSISQLSPTGVLKPLTVRDAIADLSGSRQLADAPDGFDRWRYGANTTISTYAAGMRTNSGIFTGHRRTKHSPETIARFSTVKKGANDRVGKHKRLSWDQQCPTLRAGTGRDRGSYQSVRPLHPTRNRVITVREAARLQGFPDDFAFHPTIWHSFRMIGNSVSPIIAEGLLSRIASMLNEVSHGVAAE